MKQYNKLVRDRIIEFIERDGVNYKSRILDDNEFQKELLKKIVEEAQEVFEAGSNGENKEELIMELADLQEVMDSVIQSFGLTNSEVTQVKQDRKEKRGGFEKKIFLEAMEEPGE